ncbi:hypothetical protein C1645_837844, partial [Glomus cerebriforme]
MVNENQIPIQKPVEIVHELKTDYEVPSFEEFMKDYQADENLNYDDLSGGDIGTQESYGPFHGADNGDAWISNKARIKCDKSNCINDEIKYVRFACSRHRGERVSSSGSFTYAVLLAINRKNAGDNNVDNKLMDDLLGHLYRNPFGLNNNVEFSNGNFNFIFCVNEIPYRNYQVGDEIEVDLSGAKRISSQSYHQGLVRKISSNYIEEYHGGYDLSLEGGESSSKRVGTEQSQSSITLSAYDKRIAQEIFRMTIEVLEKYIEKAGYYSDWESRKKVYDNKVTREFGNVEEAESILLSNLLGFKSVLKSGPKFLNDELKEEYYKWINATGIDVNNCPERLKHFLFEINEVLEGRGDRFVEEVAKESTEHVRKMSNEEFSKKMNEAFGAFNAPLNEEREIAKSLEGKTYKDIKNERKFSGDDKKGEQVFNQIASSVVGKHGNFDYYQKNYQQVQSSSHNLTNSQ